MSQTLKLKDLDRDGLVERRKIYFFELTKLSVKAPSPKPDREARRKKRIDRLNEQIRQAEDLIEAETRKIREAEMPFTD